jgi:hypothetical protein
VLRVVLENGLFGCDVSTGSMPLALCGPVLSLPRIQDMGANHFSGPRPGSYHGE